MYRQFTLLENIFCVNLCYKDFFHSFKNIFNVIYFLPAVWENHSAMFCRNILTFFAYSCFFRIFRFLKLNRKLVYLTLVVSYYFCIYIKNIHHIKVGLTCTFRLVNLLYYYYWNSLLTNGLGPNYINLKIIKYTVTWN